MVSKGIKLIPLEKISEEEINAIPVYVPSEEEENLSFGDPSGEQKGIKPARLSRDTEAKKDKERHQKDIFTFDDFLEAEKAGKGGINVIRKRAMTGIVRIEGYIYMWILGLKT